MNPLFTEKPPLLNSSKFDQFNMMEGSVYINSHCATSCGLVTSTLCCAVCLKNIHTGDIRKSMMVVFQLRYSVSFFDTFIVLFRY